jgi:hypothetical protein
MGWRTYMLGQNARLNQAGSNRIREHMYANGGDFDPGSRARFGYIYRTSVGHLCRGRDVGFWADSPQVKTRVGLQPMFWLERQSLVESTARVSGTVGRRAPPGGFLCRQPRQLSSQASLTGPRRGGPRGGPGTTAVRSVFSDAAPGKWPGPQRVASAGVAAARGADPCLPARIARQSRWPMAVMVARAAVSAEP